jgi:uncharacterized protein (DUF4415 family)
MVRVGQKPTKEQLKQINEIAKKPVHYSDDCPKLSAKALKEFALQRAEKNQLKKRQPVTIRLVPDCITAYQALGKGDTGILADVLTYAVNNPDVLTRAIQ